MSTVACQFGVSTQLYHAQRLRHDHLAEVAAQGFDAVEIIATRSHVDYHDPDVLDAVAGWLTREGLRLHSMHAPVMERFDGAWVNPLSIASTDDAARAQAVRETAAALELARRVPMSVLVVHPGLQDSLLSPSVRNSRRAALRSVEEIVALASPLGVRVALEVIPNAMSTAGALVAMIEELDMPGRRRLSRLRPRAPAGRRRRGHRNAVRGPHRHARARQPRAARRAPRAVRGDD